jgi:hypothetical protein
MNQPVFLFILFLLGIAGQFLSFLPKDLHKKINKFIIYLPLPAITLAKIPHLQITQEVLFPIASAWIIFFVSVAYAIMIGKIFKFQKETMACIILACGLGNTSFVGYPVLNYLYGPQSIQYAIFVDQPGSFFLMSTFGVLIAVLFSSGNFNAKIILQKLFAFPPFIIFIVSLFIPASWVENNTLDVLNFIGSFMVPLALLSLGLQFRLKLKEIEWKSFLAGISYKLVLAPLIIYVLFFLVLKKQGELYTVSVMECAMPPMITSSIIATEYGLDEKLAGILPTLGILFSIPTLFFWHWLLG